MIDVLCFQSFTTQGRSTTGGYFPTPVHQEIGNSQGFVLRYIKTAFLNRWNLLLFVGGMGFAALTGQPEIAMPIVLAAETAYLGLIGTHPKFQSYVNAQAAKEKRNRSSSQNQQVLDRIKRQLPPKSNQRYESLRQRCLHIGQISSDMKDPASFDDSHLDSLHSRGLDRLLWVFLRLLFSQHSLNRFMETVSEERIEADLKRIDEQLRMLGSDAPSSQTAKIRRTLEDNQKTLKERLENYEQAKSNYLFVTLELDRVENKIKSLSEISVNRQDPEYISDQIDLVADSIKETERTMSGLEFVTGIGGLEDEAPELLSDGIIELE